MSVSDLKSNRFRNKTAYGMIHRTLGWFVQYKDDEGNYGEMPATVWNALA